MYMGTYPPTINTTLQIVRTYVLHIYVLCLIYIQT